MQCICNKLTSSNGLLNVWWLPKISRQTRIISVFKIKFVCINRFFAIQFIQPPATDELDSASEVIGKSWHFFHQRCVIRVNLGVFSTWISFVSTYGLRNCESRTPWMTTLVRAFLCFNYITESDRYTPCCELEFEGAFPDLSGYFTNVRQSCRDNAKPLSASTLVSLLNSKRITTESLTTVLDACLERNLNNGR